MGLKIQPDKQFNATVGGGGGQYPRKPKIQHSQTMFYCTPQHTGDMSNLFAPACLLNQFKSCTKSRARTLALLTGTVQDLV